jgi:PIN domain nuclease of toxin-antitoxin system
MAPSHLLDTHALLWWLVEPEKLATKVRLGKLPRGTAASDCQPTP